MNKRLEDRGLHYQELTGKILKPGITKELTRIDRIYRIQNIL
jgi:hypothetical protein